MAGRRGEGRYAEGFTREKCTASDRKIILWSYRVALTAEKDDQTYTPTIIVLTPTSYLK
jgi:hypothetical protein